MKKVAVFGNAGGGKSTLSKQLSEITGLPLYTIDKMKFQPGGMEISQEDYERVHAEILVTDRWIIDGFGSLETLWPRLHQADTLIYVDLPLYLHFWGVTQRFITGYFKPPEGWPEQSPILKSSLNSYRALGLCHTYLTPKYRKHIKQVQHSKTVHHFQSRAQISQFLVWVKHNIPFKQD